jgi:hypothetical protein
MVTRPSDVQLAWAAGFLDGEACFGLYADGPRIEVGQVDLLPLVELQRLFGVGNLRPIEPHGNQKKRIALWSVFGSNAIEIARMIKPYLRGIKFQQAEHLSRWGELQGARNPEERALLRELCAAAKKEVDTFSQSWYDKHKPTTKKSRRTTNRRQHAVSK